MTTPTGSKPPSSHILTPSNLSVKEFEPSRVYPTKGPAGPDNYGQVDLSDKDRSRISDVGPDQSAADHYRADTDSARNALHHTLGSGWNQAAPGDHVHDGRMSSKLGPYIFNPAFNPSLPESPSNLKLIPELILTGSRGGNAALISLIAMIKQFLDFRDQTTV